MLPSWRINFFIIPTPATIIPSVMKPTLLRQPLQPAQHDWLPPYSITRGRVGRALMVFLTKALQARGHALTALFPPSVSGQITYRGAGPEFWAPGVRAWLMETPHTGLSASHSQSVGIIARCTPTIATAAVLHSTDLFRAWKKNSEVARCFSWGVCHS